MKKELGSRQRTATVTFPLALLLTLIVAVVAAKSIHAQCTRSCGAPPPDGFSLLHNFTGPPDGANSAAGLVEDTAGNFYGTTSQGGITGGACGSVGCGIVFKVDQSGNETVLHSFAGQPDGATPLAGLLLDAAGNMYGTTSLGGTSNLGTVFKLDSAGTETVLYSFTGNPDGADPVADLVLDAAGNLLGTTSLGGTASAGTVFKLDSTGKESVLYSFAGGSDGANPMAGLILDEKGNMYGTTFEGGAGSCTPTKQDRSTTPVTCGVVFELNTTGTESVLYSFTGDPDGANPAGDLVRDAAGNLYGTTVAGGILCYVIAPPLPGQGPSTEFYCGTVFKLDPTGKETLLHSFSGAPDGAIPYGGLILDAAGNLYGTTTEGGAGGCTVSSGLFGSQNLGCGSVFEVAAPAMQRCCTASPAQGSTGHQDQDWRRTPAVMCSEPRLKAVSSAANVGISVVEWYSSLPRMWTFLTLIRQHFRRRAERIVRPSLSPSATRLPTPRSTTPPTARPRQPHLLVTPAQSRSKRLNQFRR